MPDNNRFIELEKYLKKFLDFISISNKGNIYVQRVTTEDVVPVEFIKNELSEMKMVAEAIGGEKILWLKDRIEKSWQLILEHWKEEEDKLKWVRKQ